MTGKRNSLVEVTYFAVYYYELLWTLINFDVIKSEQPHRSTAVADFSLKKGFTHRYGSCHSMEVPCQLWACGLLVTYKMFSLRVMYMISKQYLFCIIHDEVILIFNQ